MSKRTHPKKDKVPTITEEEYSQYVKAIQASSAPKPPADKVRPEPKE